jgi:hypothetical protein
MTTTKENDIGELPVAMNDWERRLEPVMIVHELGLGGGSAPQHANAVAVPNIKFNLDLFGIQRFHSISLKPRRW